MRRKNVNANKSTIVCFVPLRLFAVMDVVPPERNIKLEVGRGAEAP